MEERKASATSAASPTGAVALLVDFDNVWIGLRGVGAKNASPKPIAQALLGIAERSGTVAVAKVYASEPRRNPGMAQTFMAHGYDIIAGGNAFKNLDIRMAMDGQELLFTRPEIGIYVLASGDSDFEPLAQNIVARGKSLIVTAPSASTSELIRRHATNFVPLEDTLAREGGQIVPPRRAASPISRPRVSPKSNSPKLKVFLCHSKRDKPKVRELYSRLLGEGNIEPWLDEKNILAGQDWGLEIEKAVKATHCVLVCLSASTVGAAGYVHKEILFALDVADRQPEGTIFLIPAKFDECEVPSRLSRYQWVNLFEEDGYAKLLRGLHARANTLEK